MSRNSNTLIVHVDREATSRIANPSAEPDLEWSLRYAPQLPKAMRLAAAEILSSFDNLLSDQITMGEAIRRLGLLRAAHWAAKTPGVTSPDHSAQAGIDSVVARAHRITGDPS